MRLPLQRKYKVLQHLPSAKSVAIYAFPEIRGSFRF